MSDPFSLDQFVARLANIPSFNIWSVTDVDTIAPWYEVAGHEIVDDLLIHETDLARDVSTVSVQIMHWGRLEAQAKRVWEITERRYRQWRDALILRACTPPPGDDKWKKPTEHVLEASYRATGEYREWQQQLERAEEAYNCAKMLRDAFLAKRDMLRVAVMRAYDGSGPRLSV